MALSHEIWPLKPRPILWEEDTTLADISPDSKHKPPNIEVRKPSGESNFQTSWHPDSCQVNKSSPHWTCSNYRFASKYICFHCFDTLSFGVIWYKAIDNWKGGNLIY